MQLVLDGQWTLGLLTSNISENQGLNVCLLLSLTKTDTK